MIEYFFRFLPGRTVEQTHTPIVPRGKEHGLALGVVIAIMSFLACLALGSVGLISNAVQDWQGQISREATIQILPLEGVDVEKSLADAHALVRSFAGITDAYILDEQETQKLLEPWLGRDSEISHLDLPRLIIVRFQEAALPDLDLIRARLQQDVKGARFDDHHLWISRLSSMANTLILSSIAIFMLVLVAMIVTTFFATRAILLMHAHIIEVLHLLGSEPHFVARQFDRYFFKLGFKGALGGALAASLTFWLLHINLTSLRATAETNQFALLFGTFSLGVGSLATMVLLVILIAAMVMLTSRSTVIRQLHGLDRHQPDF